VWLDDELVGLLDLLLRYPDDETVYLGLLLIERSVPGATTSSAPRRS
jgi:hypothetical protein